MEFSILRSHFQCIDFHPLKLPELTNLSSAGVHHDGPAHTITLDMFTNDFYVLGFDLTPDTETDEEHISLPRQRNVHNEARFKKHYQNPSNAFCLLNTLDTLKSTTLGTLQ